MMSSNLAAAENGGVDQTQSDWWLARWSSQLACLGACILGFIGVLTFIGTSVSCMFAGAGQVATAILVLSVEGSSFVSALSFAKPIGQFFVGRPVWLKTAVYAIATILPMVMIECHGFFVILGFLVSAAITAIYGMLLIGRKGQLDDMRQTANQPSYP